MGNSPFSMFRKQQLTCELHDGLPADRTQSSPFPGSTPSAPRCSTHSGSRPNYALAFRRRKKFATVHSWLSELFRNRVCRFPPRQNDKENQQLNKPSTCRLNEVVLPYYRSNDRTINFSEEVSAWKRRSQRVSPPVNKLGMCVTGSRNFVEHARDYAYTASSRVSGCSVNFYCKKKRNRFLFTPFSR
jgi:hypothetical protein